MTEMTPVEALFFAALQKPTPQERAAYLERACGGDADLRQRVERLLAAHPQVGSFLEAPAAGPTSPCASPHAQTACHAGPSEEVGSVLAGRYQLLEVIGEGGMGRVFLAQQTEPVKRLVALKVIKAGMDSRQVLARFEVERQALALMDHPNIARVLDAGTTPDGRPFFVMELVKGTPITRYCDEHHLTPRQRLELFVPVCQAIQHAHQKGIIHRDVKPSNVLVALYDDRPVPKVIDFGVAKATGHHLTEQTLNTGFGAIVGTLEYMSPEQADISQLDIDTRSDIYALGVLLYELLTGSPPFRCKELAQAGLLEMLRVIREQQPAKPSTKLSTAGGLPTLAANRGMEPAKLTKLVRGELDWIVMKALEKDRNRRYETANGLAKDVQRYLADEPVLACPPSVGYRFRKFARRNTRALATAALLGAMLLVVAGTFGWMAVDGAARQTRTANEVNQFLRRAESLYADNKLPEAVAEVHKARGVLEAGSGDAELGRRVREWLADLAMVARLQDWHAGQADLVPGELLKSSTKAFRDYGIDVETLPPAEAAARVAARPIRIDLALALDRMAVIQKYNRQEPARWRPLLAIARAADPDPWRNQLRDLVEQADSSRDELLRLAETADAAALSPRSWDLLADTLRQAGERDATIAVHRKALQRHPDDFSLCLGMASVLFDLEKPAADAKAVEFARAAVALRPGSARAHTNLGSALHRRGRLEESEAACREGIRLQPTFRDAHLNLGVTLRDLGRLDEAIAAAREAIRLEPSSHMPYNNLGVVLRDQKRQAEAEAAFRKAIRLMPNDPIAHYNLGETLVAQGRLSEAEAAFRKTIRYKPNLPRPHYELGNVLREQGKLAEAAAAHRKAIALAPEYPAPHNSLGMVLRDMGRLEEAAAAHREAIRLAPRDEVAHTNLGVDLEELGRFEEALAAHRKAILLKPDFYLAHCNLGVVLGKMNRFKEAEAAIREALRLKPDFPPAHSNLGLALAGQQRFDEAVAAYKKAIDIKPDHAWTHIYLGNALSKQGRPAEAVAAFRKAIEIKPDLYQAHLDLGLALLAQREPARAAAAFRNAIRLLPNDPAAHNNLGNALASQGKLGEAATAFRLAIRVRPDSPWAHRSLGSVLRRQKRYEEAIAAHRVAIYLKPDYHEAYSSLGAALGDQGKSGEAEAAYRKAAQIKPDDFVAHHGLGLTLRSQGKLEEAATALQKAVELNRASVRAHQDLGDVYARLGRWAKAASAYGRCTELAPNGPGWFYVAAIHLTAGDAEGYRRASREMMRRFGATTAPEVAAWVARACCLAPDSGVDFGRVAKLAERAVAGDEKHFGYRYAVLARGLAEYRAGRPAEAVKWLDRFGPVAGGGNREATAFAALAMAQHRVGRAEEAAAALARARAILKEKMPDPAGGRPFGPPDWAEWVHAQILVREAEALVKD